MSTNEVERLKPADVQWITHAWPLCFDVPMSRAACAQLIVNYGWPDPPKSSCYICPHRQNRQWRKVRENPQEWHAALALDASIRERDARHDVYLHWSGKPLAEADLSDHAEEAAGYSQPGLFECSTMWCMA